MARRAVVYWDSAVFLALINQDMDPVDMQGASNVWVSAEKGLMHIVTSTLTTAEVIYMKGTPKLDPAKRVLVSNFFRQPFISQKPLTREIAELARDVVWDNAIKPKDAAHVATCAYFKIHDTSFIHSMACYAAWARLMSPASSLLSKIHMPKAKEKCSEPKSGKPFPRSNASNEHEVLRRMFLAGRA